MRAPVLVIAIALSLTGSSGVSEAGCMPRPAAVKPEALPWLAGSWIERAGKTTAAQYWSGPVDGFLLGHEVVTRADGTASYAYLRIAVGDDGALTLFVQPHGGEAVTLKAVEACPSRIVFEAPVPGYPDRIIYSRDLEAAPAMSRDTAEERRFLPQPPYPFLM